MSVIDDYLATLSGTEKDIVAHMYDVVREAVPNATEELSYAMPAFKHQGKAFIAIMVNKDFMSMYPFGAVEQLGLDLSNFECTSGSIHFTQQNPVSDDLLRKIIAASLRKSKK